MKRIFLSLTALLWTGTVLAQMPNETDALNFSATGINGTAAQIGKGGAIGAVGGDLMSASYNPAGLGIYNSSILSFSPGFYFNKTKTNYTGDPSSDYKINMQLGNLGVLFNINGGEEKGWKSVQFYLGFNRLKSFGNRAKFHGTITKQAGVDSPDSYISSIIEGVVGSDNAQNNDFVQTGVISYDTTINSWVSEFHRNSGRFEQLQAITESGFMNELAFSLSGNYNNFLYVGATLGIPLINYSSNITFSETAFDNSGNSLDKYSHTQKHAIDGAGVNLKLGAIVRPLPWLRIGAAFHTPTFYGLTDEYYSRVERNDKISGGWFQPLEYTMVSPLKFIGSIAGVFGSRSSGISGLLGIDYEYQNFSFLHYRFDNYPEYERNINNAMSDDIFQSVHNLKFGGELRLGAVCFRGGYGLLANPYKKEINDLSQSYFTAGVGIGGRSWFFDVAYAHVSTEASHYLYSRSFSPAASVNSSQNIVMTTIGFRF